MKEARTIGGYLTWAGLAIGLGVMGFSCASRDVYRYDRRNVVQRAWDAVRGRPGRSTTLFEEGGVIVEEHVNGEGGVQKVMTYGAYDSVKSGIFYRQYSDGRCLDVNSRTELSELVDYDGDGSISSREARNFSEYERDILIKYLRKREEDRYERLMERLKRR